MYIITRFTHTHTHTHTHRGVVTVVANSSWRKQTEYVQKCADKMMWTAAEKLCASGRYVVVFYCYFGGELKLSFIWFLIVLLHKQLVPEAWKMVAWDVQNTLCDLQPTDVCCRTRCTGRWWRPKGARTNPTVKWQPLEVFLPGTGSSWIWWTPWAKHVLKWLPCPPFCCHTSRLLVSVSQTKSVGSVVCVSICFVW